jgi:hypothetical protein
MNKIDRLKVKELHDQGVRVTDIAKQLGCGKGTVSKILKQMGLEVVKAALTVAPKYVDTKDAASDHLLFLAEKAKQELEWIEKGGAPEHRRRVPGVAGPKNQVHPGDEKADLYHCRYRLQALPGFGGYGSAAYH